MFGFDSVLLPFVIVKKEDIQQNNDLKVIDIRKKEKDVRDVTIVPVLPKKSTQSNAVLFVRDDVSTSGFSQQTDTVENNELFQIILSLRQFLYFQGSQLYSLYSTIVENQEQSTC